MHGYEMHVGVTAGADCARPLLFLDGAGPEGAMSADGRIAGCYVHGLFGEDGFRAAFLSRFGVRGGLSYDRTVEQALDDCAAACETHLDLDGLLALTG